MPGTGPGLPAQHHRSPSDGLQLTPPITTDTGTSRRQQRTDRYEPTNHQPFTTSTSNGGSGLSQHPRTSFAGLWSEKSVRSSPTSRWHPTRGRPSCPCGSRKVLSRVPGADMCSEVRHYAFRAHGVAPMRHIPALPVKQISHRGVRYRVAIRVFWIGSTASKDTE